MSRFAVITEEVGKKIIEDKESKKTQKMTRVAMNAFYCWLAARKHTIDEESITLSELDEFLYHFYFEVRKQDGKMYTKSAYRGLRHGIQRHFKRVRNVDIINDTEFSRSSEAFTAQCVAMKKQGLAKVRHKEAINKSDMEKLYASNVFDVHHPKSLQRKVFFELEYYFCRRAMENVRSLTTRSFVLKKDENGMEYVALDIEEFEKTYGPLDGDYEGGIMLATNKANCPVSSYKKYLSKLNPSIDTLFQRPRTDASDHRPWYDAQVVGVKSLEKMMKEISRDAGLSQTYTNHCIRATCITMLDQQGFEARHIMSLSGHRSEASIRAYSRTNIGTKRKMSEVLSLPTANTNADPQPSPSTSRPTTSNTSHQNTLREVSSVPTFDFALRNAFPEDEEEDEVDRIMSSIDIVKTTTQTNQVNKFNAFFGANTNPVFNNCTFNFK